MCDVTPCSLAEGNVYEMYGVTAQKATVCPWTPLVTLCSMMVMDVSEESAASVLIVKGKTLRKRGDTCEPVGHPLSLNLPSRFICSSPFTLRMVAAFASETLVPSYCIARRRTQKVDNRQ
jgi:hypothetical protein